MRSETQPYSTVLQYLPRPQSLSRGEKKTEKNFFLGRAKNNGKAKNWEKNPSLLMFQHPAALRVV